MRKSGLAAGAALLFTAACTTGATGPAPTTAATATAPAAGAPELAITFDDLPAHGPLPPGTTRLEVVDRIVAALKSHDVPAQGFMNGGFGADNPQSPVVLQHWRAAGYPIGNHTFNHLNLDQNTVADYEAQIEKNEPILQKLMAGQDWHWFRYPFLAEGTDPAKRDAVRGWFRAHGYRIAAVTMSFSDYAWNAPYARCVAKGNDQAIAGLEASYLAAAREDAEHHLALSKAVLGREIPFVLLMHLGAFDAHMLPRLLDLYQSMGFRFVPMQTAEADPFYRSATDLSLPGPSPTLEAAARAKGVPVQASAPVPGDDVCA